MRLKGLIPTSLVILSFASFGAAQAEPPIYIVQAPTASAARESVLQVHGRIERELPIIHAVAARLDVQQAAQLRAASRLRVFEDRPVNTRSTLLGGLTNSLTTTTSNLVNTTNSTLATNPLVTTVTSTTTPVTSTVLTDPLVSTVTTPVVSTLSTSTGTQDGTGVAALTLTYETNYPMEVGADALQKAGITGKGVTIAVLDTGLWQDLFQNYG